LYQVVAISGYYTDWIPISLTKGKQRELNRKWLRICKELKWQHIPMNLSRVICKDGLDENYKCEPPIFPTLPDRQAIINEDVIDESKEELLDDWQPESEGTEFVIQSENKPIPQTLEDLFDLSDEEIDI
jgi:hypothetical protein